MIGPFIGKYRFLSNFYPAPILVEGIWFPTVEHAYQWAKTEDGSFRKWITEAPTPGVAKGLGSRAPLRSNWERVKLEVMRALVTEKFRREFVYGELGAQLFDTGDEELVEVNDWGDTFWGVCRGVGENHLGKILMQIRSELPPF